MKVKIVRRRCGPEPHRVDGLAAVTYDRAVKGNSNQSGRLAGDALQRSSGHLDRGVQPDLDLLVRPDDFPRVRPAEPVVGLFFLPAILDRLTENAVFVSQAVTHGGKLQ